MSASEIGKPGFRYKTDFDRPDADLVESYRELMNKTGCLTGNVGDCIGRAAAVNARVKNLAAGMKVVGPAFTVRVPPTDNLMIHKALTLIQPGDVLVIDGGGNHSWALLGWLMVSTAIKLGIAGIVADGCVRDAQEIRASGFPLFCAGLSPNGPFKEGPGEINYPISCGGQIVRPGDMIIGDDDGVVVLQKELAAATIDKVYQVIQREENRLKEIADGQVIRPGIDEMLEKKGITP
ncbi:MAG: RraA family protein, partial [Desulfobacterales bacterium]|jgi:RraA family protein